MSEERHTVALSVELDGSRDDAVAVAVELFNAFWNSRHILSVEQLTVDGEAAYEEVRRAFAGAAPARPARKE